MKIIENVLRAILGHGEDNDDTNEDNFSTDEKEKGNDLGCEQQIIKCQVKNGRLLSSTSKSCEIKYGHDTTRRAKMRLSQRRKRGNCSVEREQEYLAKLFKPSVEMYFKKKNEDYFKGAL